MKRLAFIAVFAMISVYFVGCGRIVDYIYLPECQSSEDKIKGCVNKLYAFNEFLASETPYKNGKRHGIAKDYYLNGKLSREIPYKKGKKDGVEKEYRENGKLWSETPHKDDKKEGIERWYYPNGKLWSETPYKHNTIDGVMKVYHEDGSLHFTIVYENDEIKSGKCGDGREIVSNTLRELDGKMPYNYRVGCD